MGGHTLRILVVEDEFVVAQTLAECLRGHGHDCIGPVATVASALALAEAEPFDAAILDIRLGDERVDAVADLVAARHLPLAFSVARLEDVDQSRWPYAMILLKPYNDGQVVELLGRLVRARFASA